MMSTHKIGRETEMNRISVLLSSILLCCTEGYAQTESELRQEASALAEKYVAQLKPELKSAMQSRGPSHAIEVCATLAPRIADALTAESGWQVSRVSLKQRNVGRAMPDKWERGVLQKFDRRQAEGVKVAELNHGEVVGGHYRFMQAQLVEPVCLVCHGESLSDEVKATLHLYYPDDIATGYSLGQVRGAISLSRSLR
jgi:hypothetical protein